MHADGSVALAPATLPLAARDLRFQRVQVPFPERAKRSEPLVDFLQRIRFHCIDATRPVLPHAREAALAKHTQMLRHRTLRDPELRLNDLDNLARAVLAAGEEFEDAAANGIAASVR